MALSAELIQQLRSKAGLADLPTQPTLVNKTSSVPQSGLSQDHINGLRQKFGLDPLPDTNPPADKEFSSGVPGFIRDVGNQGMSFVNSVVEGAGRGLGNAASAIQKPIAGAADYLGNLTTELTGAPNFFNDISSQLNEATDQNSTLNTASQQRQEAVRQKLGGNKTASDVGGFVGEALPSIALTAPIAPETTLPKTLAEGINLFGKSLASTAAIKQLSSAGNSSASLKDYGLGAVLDVLAPTLGSVLKGVGNEITASALKRTPAKVAQDVKQGLNVGEAMNKNIGPSLTKSSLVGKISNVISDASDKLDNLIQKTQQATNYSSKPANLVSDLTNVVQKADGGEIFKGLGRKERQRAQKVIMDKALGFLDSLPEVATLPEYQAAKKSIGQSLGDKGFFEKLFADKLTKIGDQTNKAIYNQTKTLIEDKVPGAKALNEFMAPLLSAKKSLKKSPGYLRTVISQLVGAGAAVQGSGGISAAVSDPSSFLKKFVAGELLFQLSMGTPGRTGTGKVLYETGKKIKNTAVQQGLKQLQQKQYP